MYRLTVLYPPPADPDHFREYYVNTHLPLAAKLPGLRAMRYSLDVRAAGGGDSPYFAIFEGDFDSQDAMIAALSSDEGKAVNADVANYATGGAQVIHYAPVAGT
ncbi:EthD family reductase [Prauserella flavalba]|uniref:Ethyl tert-butyl ether degradation protein EthD n=1 Tax=Prauserella flavalba TaxID=1477506 RepID=A0A318M0K2_9PSEU|nr:EthD family reductase [Prauserella flavalba]PXY36055.1 ethyl tert-butyl ether degradation protein EthD [Prauserella flavalba]